MSALQQTLFDNGRWLRFRGNRSRVWKLQNVDDGSELYLCTGARFNGSPLTEEHFVPLSDFFPSAQRRMRDEGTSVMCRHCQRLYSAAWERTHQDWRRAYSRRRKRSTRQRLGRRFFTELRGSARSRARQLGIPFDLPRYYLHELAHAQQFRCCKLRLHFSAPPDPRVKHWPYLPSPDQIVPSSGYIVGNVQLVCLGYNRLKWNNDQSVADRFIADIDTRVPRAVDEIGFAC